jgi:hypothetical protein
MSLIQKNEICCICNLNPVMRTKSASSLKCSQCSDIFNARLKHQTLGPDQAKWCKVNPFPADPRKQLNNNLNQ